MYTVEGNTAYFNGPSYSGSVKALQGKLFSEGMYGKGIRTECNPQEQFLYVPVVLTGIIVALCLLYAKLV